MCIDIEYQYSISISIYQYQYIDIYINLSISIYRYIIVNCKKIKNNVNIMLPLIIKELYMYMHGRHWKDTQDHL